MSDQHNSSSITDEDEISLLDLLTVIFENLKLLILGPLTAGILALGVSFLITPTFTAKTTMIPPGQSSGGGAAALLGQLGGLGALAVVLLELKCRPISTWLIWKVILCVMS